MSLHHHHSILSFQEEVFFPDQNGKYQYGLITNQVPFSTSSDTPLDASTSSRIYSTRSPSKKAISLTRRPSPSRSPFLHEMMQG